MLASTGLKVALSRRLLHFSVRDDTLTRTQHRKAVGLPPRIEMLEVAAAARSRNRHVRELSAAKARAVGLQV